MSAAKDPYVKVYYRVADDPRFESVFYDDAALSWWLRLLLIADGAWPATAHIPASCKPRALKLLVDVGLIELAGNHRYRVHGMDAERARSADHAARASNARWSGNPPSNARGNAPSNPQTMPLNSDDLNSSKRNASQRISPPAGEAKNGSKEPDDEREERLARAMSVLNNPASSPSMIEIANNEVARLRTN